MDSYNRTSFHKSCAHRLLKKKSRREGNGLQEEHNFAIVWSFRCCIYSPSTHPSESRAELAPKRVQGRYNSSKNCHTLYRFESCLSDLPYQILLSSCRGYTLLVDKTINWDRRDDIQLNIRIHLVKRILPRSKFHKIYTLS